MSQRSLDTLKDFTESHQISVGAELYQLRFKTTDFRFEEVEVLLQVTG